MIAVIAGVTVIVLKHNGPGTPTYGLIPTGSTPQADGAQITTAFLKAWESGNLTKAANLTSDPAAAKAALAANAKYLDLGKMTATTGSVTSGTTVSASTAPRPRARRPSSRSTPRWRPRTAPGRSAAPGTTTPR